MDTGEFTQDDNSVLYEARLINKTDASITQISTNLVSCQSGAVFKDDENSRFALKSYLIPYMVLNINNTSGSVVFSAGKYGLKEENKPILLTLGAFYFSDRKEIGSSSSVPYIKVGTIPQTTPQVPHYFDRRTFCKKDAVLCSELSLIAYDFTGLEQKLKNTFVLGRALNLELQFEGNGYDTQGFIATNTEKDTIYISFRGSEGNKYFPPPTDWLYNYLVLSFQGVDDIKTMHKAIYGMAVRYTDVRSLVIDKVQSLLYDTNYNVNKVIVTGHSLGAALANILTAELSYYFGGITVVQYTFGTPPIINSYLNAYINNKIMNNESSFGSYNFYDLRDPVAKGFSEHAGYLGFWWYPIRIPFYGPDASNPHSISRNYIPYIKTLSNIGTCSW